jgi:hypothetical protein
MTDQTPQPPKLLLNRAVDPGEMALVTCQGCGAQVFVPDRLVPLVTMQHRPHCIGPAVRATAAALQLLADFISRTIPEEPK